MSTPPPTSPPFPFTGYPETIQTAAKAILNAYNANQTIPLLSKTLALDQETAYQISSAITTLRQTYDDAQPLGRKIGFTNPSMWTEYSIYAPNWSHMYSTTIQSLSSSSFSISSLNSDVSTTIDLSPVSALQPRIEPELALCLARAPNPAMSLAELIECIEWIAPAFEIVVSVFESGWKFSAEDTTAACALHYRLLLGGQVYVREILAREAAEMGDEAAKGEASLLGRTEDFEVDLLCNGELREQGRGRNALGGAVKALQHLVKLLDRQGQEGRDGKLREGEIVTTGTLTQALVVEDGQRWMTELRGIELRGMDVSFKF